MKHIKLYEQFINEKHGFEPAKEIYFTGDPYKGKQIYDREETHNGIKYYGGIDIPNQIMLLSKNDGKNIDEIVYLALADLNDAGEVFDLWVDDSRNFFKRHKGLWDLNYDKHIEPVYKNK